MLDENLNVISQETDFGFQVIVGAKGEIYGFASLGVEGDIRLGFKFENGRVAINGEGNAAIGVLVGEAEANASTQVEVIDSADERFCFAAGTLIDMADGTQRPIEQIKVGDRVVAYDETAEHGRGALVPSRVT